MSRFDSKRIPLQAGLGGGSSDAAAALRALRALWRVGFRRERLRAIAAPLGADVPFFLQGGTALGVGAATSLFPLADLPPAWVRWCCRIWREHQGRVRLVRRSFAGQRRVRATVRAGSDPPDPDPLALPESGNDLQPPVARVIPRSAARRRAEAVRRQAMRRCRAAARPCSALVRRRSRARRGPAATLLDARGGAADRIVSAVRLIA